jgi:CBS-domain-containing membrane protein
MYEKLRRQVRITRYHFNKQLSFDLNEHFWAFIGSFIGIGSIAWIQSHSFSDIENIFLIGSFGASSVLIYGAIKSPLAQPRNLVGGHLISAIVGVTVYKLIPDPIWISAPLAVALAVIFMQITKTVHPPGGATALIAVIGTAKVKALGYIYVLSPVLSGVLILLLVALVVNNISKKRHYPINGPLTKTRALLRRKRKK